MLKDRIVPVEKLKNRYNPSDFNFNTTKDINSYKEVIGQNRAMKALKFGLSIKRKGYNIYVSGLTGTGRNSYSYSIAKEFANKEERPKDWCYVYNFDKKENPKAIQLEAGKGFKFTKEIESIISKLKGDIPKLFESKEFEDKKNVIYKQYDNKMEKIISELNEISVDHGFMFKRSEKGLVSIPLKDGKPMTENQLENLTEEEIDDLRKRSGEISADTVEIINKIKDLEEQLKNRLKQLKEKAAFNAVDYYIDPLIDKYKRNVDIEKYLNELEDDIIKNIDKFLQQEDEENITEIVKKKIETNDFFNRYKVNLFIDNKNLQGSPVIKDSNPNYYNLLGKIEYFNEMGILKTDHTRIKPGLIHEANGGYLIIQAKDILKSGAAWEGLKRALTSQEARIENISKGSVVAESIKPESIPIKLKVIIVGDYYTYQLLYSHDEDFRKLFKIRADFDVEMKRNEENVRKIASFIAYQCKEENLKEFDKTAVARVVEYSSRLAEDQKKLTSRFNEIVEILYEADAWADYDGEDIVTEKYIDMAIYEKINRNNKYEEKLQELFKNETLIIDTYGSKIGEINGLAVMDAGQYSFGKPNKITVTTFVGKDGIINIEREVEQSGSIYDKGVMILSGYLGSMYAKKNPLSLTASITFEQSYDGIDGDSASSTELYALLSSLSEIPIKQGIAVTGSVSQKGMIQPIGGVNEKIEGYYKVCKEKGLKGGEGVIIPHQNIDNLMLSDEVINAIEDGKFTIYAVETIDQGIEILTGIPAGELNEKGEYPIGSVNYLVQKKLDSYADLNKDYE